MGKMKKAVVPWLFLAPSLGGVALFTGLPFLDVIRRSFTDAMGTRFVGISNYQAVLHNEAFRLAAKNTACFLLTCIPLLLLTSFLAALLIRAGAKEGREGESQGFLGLCRTTLVLPMVIPAASIRERFGRQTGHFPGMHPRCWRRRISGSTRGTIWFYGWLALWGSPGNFMRRQRWTGPGYLPGCGTLPCRALGGHSGWWGSYQWRMLFGYIGKRTFWQALTLIPPFTLSPICLPTGF